MKVINIIAMFSIFIIPAFSQTTNSDLETINYFPVKVGNTWYYNEPPPNAYIYSIRTIHDSLRINGLKYFTWTDGESKVYIDTIRVDEQNNILKHYKGTDYMWFDFTKEHGAIYYYPPGDWYDSWDNKQLKCNVYVYRIYEYNVTLGTFHHCIRFHVNINEILDEDTYYYFAPDVGLIQESGCWVYQELVYAIIDGNHITSVHSNKPVIPDTKLYQNYPNPFNAETTFRFHLDQPTNVTLKIFNIIGEEVYTVYQDYSLSGFYELTWYAEDIASGTYFYQLITEQYSNTKKMIIIK